jgi:hypothetical protein
LITTAIVILVGLGVVMVSLDTRKAYKPNEVEKAVVSDETIGTIKMEAIKEYQKKNK